MQHSGDALEKKNNVFSLIGSLPMYTNRVMGDTYPIYVCTGLITRVISSVHGTFCGNWKERLFKATLDIWKVSIFEEKGRNF